MAEPTSVDDPPEVTMSVTPRPTRPAESDPWWDLEGKAAKTRRRRKRRTGDMAFVIALLALLLVVALWLERALEILG